MVSFTFTITKYILTYLFSVNIQFKIFAHFSIEVPVYFLSLTCSCDILRILVLLHLSCILQIVFLPCCLLVYSIFYHTVYILSLYSPRKAFFQPKSTNITFMFYSYVVVWLWCFFFFSFLYCIFSIVNCMLTFFYLSTE